MLQQAPEPSRRSFFCFKSCRTTQCPEVTGAMARRQLADAIRSIESAGTKASDDKDDRVKRNQATRGTYSQPHEAVCWLARLHGGSFSGR